jgi:hypothetical protein
MGVLIATTSPKKQGRGGNHPQNPAKNHQSRIYRVGHHHWTKKKVKDENQMFWGR